ncbi:hypothetical protein EDC04DRAFT_2611837 [Pisolithus marmoratus]|nr:hypothetical protein EDC04DRAFT_2611837 [Pisolithus marmoratus]
MEVPFLHHEMAIDGIYMEILVEMVIKYEEDGLELEANYRFLSQAQEVYGNNLKSRRLPYVLCPLSIVSTPPKNIKDDGKCIEFVKKKAVQLLKGAQYLCGDIDLLAAYGDAAGEVIAVKRTAENVFGAREMHAAEGLECQISSGLAHAPLSDSCGSSVELAWKGFKEDFPVSFFDGLERVVGNAATSGIDEADGTSGTVDSGYGQDLEVLGSGLLVLVQCLSPYERWLHWKLNLKVKSSARFGPLKLGLGTSSNVCGLNA